MSNTIGNYLNSRWSVRMMAIFYIIAGFNHFINPEFYLPLIPPAFPKPEWINYGSGMVEIFLGIGVYLPKTRKFAAYAVVLMLVAFIPSHVYFIQIGSCIGEGLCVAEWIGWVRLLLIHPILIFWAWSVGKSKDLSSR